MITVYTKQGYYVATYADDQDGLRALGVLAGGQGEALYVGRAEEGGAPTWYETDVLTGELHELVGSPFEEEESEESEKDTEPGFLVALFGTTLQFSAVGLMFRAWTQQPLWGGMAELVLVCVFLLLSTGGAAALLVGKIGKNKE